MEDPLQAFLDTQAVEGEQFDTTSERFRSLRKLVEKGSVILYTTDLTQREIQRRISKRCVAASKAWEPFVEMVLRQDHPPPEVSSGLSKKVSSFLWERWQAFCADLKVTVVVTRHVSLVKLLDAYFEMRPPFSEKKPKEFPDAIALLALAKYAGQTGHPLYIVSGDSDLSSPGRISKHLRGGFGLAEFLDMVHSRDTLAEGLRRSLRASGLETPVIVELKASLVDEPDVFRLAGQRLYVRDVSVYAIRLDELHIIDLDHEAKTARVQWDGTAAIRLSYSLDNSTFATIVHRVPIQPLILASRIDMPSPEFTVEDPMVRTPIDLRVGNAS